MNARLAAVSTPTERDWNEVVEADPDAMVTQTQAWIRAIEATSGWRDSSRMIDGPSGRIIVPMVRRRGTAGPSRVVASQPSGYGFGGMIAEGGVNLETVGLVAAMLEADRSLRLSIRPNPLHHEFWNAACRNWIPIPRRANVLDLNGGPDDVLARMHQSARRNVRKAVDQDLEIRRSTDGSNLESFFELMELSRARWAETSHEPLFIAKARARHDTLARWKRIAAAADGCCRVYTAHDKGRPVAGIIVLVGPQAHYTRGAMDKEPAGRLRANYALHWQAIRDAAAAGSHWYHMGESGTSSSLARFKSQLGAVSYDYAEYRRESIPITRVDSRVRALVKSAVGFREAR
jgi:hypothetical protein